MAGKSQQWVCSPTTGQFSSSQMHLLHVVAPPPSRKPGRLFWPDRRVRLWSSISCTQSHKALSARELQVTCFQDHGRIVYAWTPKVCERTAFWVCIKGFGAMILHTFGVQVVAWSLQHHHSGNQLRHGRQRGPTTSFAFAWQNPLQVPATRAHETTI